jgi:hypothetical protein
MSDFNINELAYAIMARDDYDKAEEVHLSVYEVARCYGGPEEGGWWYDAWVFQGSVKCATREGAEKIREDMLKELKPERNPHAYAALGGDDTCTSSCPEGYIPRGWSEGIEYQVLIEDRPGQRHSTERPRYE